MPIFPSCISMLVPERLEFLVNKYAEHTHEKWSLDKVISPKISFTSVKIDKTEMYHVPVETEPPEDTSHCLEHFLTVFGLWLDLCLLSDSLLTAGFTGSSCVKIQRFIRCSSHTGL